MVVTAALFATQDRLEAEPDFARRLLTVNFANTVVLCEDVRRRMLARGGGTLCVFSSVAGERGRKPVVIYGAAKAGLTHYLEGLDHRFHDRGLRAICVKPGFVRTGMTEDLKAPPFAGEPDAVARDVVRAIDRGAPVVYAPGIWRWIMLVIRLLAALRDASNRVLTYIIARSGFSSCHVRVARFAPNRKNCARHAKTSVDVRAKFALNAPRRG